jgi:hypothetical protein
MLLTEHEHTLGTLYLLLNLKYSERLALLKLNDSDTFQ